MQRRDHGPGVAAAGGEATPTIRYPLRHLARFILIGLYTGSRCGAIAAASPVRKEGRSWVDLDRGIFYRLATGRLASPTKRQTPAPIPPRLLAHLRRWQRLGVSKEHFVEWYGKLVKSVKTAFKSALDKAGVEGPVSPHTLRHTAVTWLMQNGAPMWQVAGFVGMSEQMIREVYGHHHPDHMQEVVAASGRRGGDRPRPAPVVSLEEVRHKREAAARRPPEGGPRRFCAAATVETRVSCRGARLSFSLRRRPSQDIWAAGWTSGFRGSKSRFAQ